MVEYGRFAQIEALAENGWVTDEETELFEAMTQRQGLIGAPTYLRAPDGRIYECTGGVETPVHGDYPLTVIDGSERMTHYEDGRKKWAQG